jgi:hypothetical protein
VERGVTIILVTLNTGAGFLLADVTNESPSRRRNTVDGIDWLEENRVGESDFRDP